MTLLHTLLLLNKSTFSFNVKFIFIGVISILISVLKIVPHENSFVGIYDDEEMKTNEDPNYTMEGVSYSGLHESALKCLWVVASSSIHLAKTCVSLNVVSVLRRLPIDKMGWGASVLQVLLSSDVESRTTISEEYGEDVLEQMLLFSDILSPTSSLLYLIIYSHLFVLPLL